MIGSVWVFHGLYSKLLGGVPRHRLIVARVLGEDWASTLTYLVGVGELCLGLWIWSGFARRTAASVETLALVTMNLLEVTFARDLLISVPGMLALNVLFLTASWWWAIAPEPDTSGGR